MITPELGYTHSEIEEARRLHAKLSRLPRLRMTTTAGRLTLNALLWLAELYPLLRRRTSGPRVERRTIQTSRGRTKLRVFRCSGPSAGIILHFHGGGWTIGNARMSDDENAQLAARLDVTVVAVDYHLAVFRSLDELIEECAAVAAWVLDNAGPSFGAKHVLFWGSSAGAHLAAAALLRLRGARALFTQVSGVVLLYGLYDLGGTSMVRKAGSGTVLLDAPTVRRTLQKLTPGMSDAERRDGRLSPLFAELSAMPPALFLVGERDMLLEDSQHMARRWHDANENATLVVVPESPHAFDRFDTKISRKVQNFVETWVSDYLGCDRIDPSLRRLSEEQDGDEHANT